MIKSSLLSLEKYIDYNNYKGYDPYDTLNSSFPLKYFGKWFSILAIQFQKRNPINIRPLLGVKAGINPKGMGLLLKAYCILYEIENKNEYYECAKNIYVWLINNYSEGYSGICWGYNFDWANPEEYLKAFEPNVVVTGTVIDGIYKYSKIFQDTQAREIVISSSDFVLKDLPIINIDTKKCIGYNTNSKNCCYNASLYGSLILSFANRIKPNKKYQEIIDEVVAYVLSKQKTDGSWYYSYNIEQQTERRQIDFHQGFILVLLNDIIKDYSSQKDILTSIQRGINYYKDKQFYKNGRSKWRLPKKWPVDIHNQSQGIITFSKFAYLNKEYLSFSHNIANWTITNMQAEDGYFYYRNYKYFKNKISYIRWSQSWMFLALVELMKANKIYSDEEN